MKRYLRTVLVFWKASVSTEAEYRGNFVMSALQSLIGVAGAVFGVSLFYQGGHELGGWPWHEALIVVGAYTLLDGSAQTFLTPNRGRITELVQQGTLDFVLLKPIDTQFWLSTHKISLWGIPNMLVGIGLVLYAGVQHDPPITTTDYLVGLIPMLMGIFILYCIGFTLGTLTIWFTKLHNITMAMQAMLETGRFPMPAYPPVYRALFTFVLPVAFMTTVPAEAILGRATPSGLIGAAVLSVGLFAFSRWFWRFALRSYTSASS